MLLLFGLLMDLSWDHANEFQGDWEAHIFLPFHAENKCLARREAQGQPLDRWVWRDILRRAFDHRHRGAVTGSFPLQGGGWDGVALGQGDGDGLSHCI